MVARIKVKDFIEILKSKKLSPDDINDILKAIGIEERLDTNRVTNTSKKEANDRRQIKEESEEETMDLEKEIISLNFDLINLKNIFDSYKKKINEIEKKTNELENKVSNLLSIIEEYLPNIVKKQNDKQL